MDRKILLLLFAICVVFVLLWVDIPSTFFAKTPQNPLPTTPGPLVISEANRASDAPLPAPITPEELPTITNAVAESAVTILASSTYLVINDSCGPYFGGACVNIRSGPSASTSRILLARNGMVLHVDEALTREDHTWYRIVFDEWLRFPERASDAWYIADGFGETVEMPASEIQHTEGATTTAKHIIIDRSDQMLTAYDNEVLFMKERVSTGLDLTPTPRGTFSVFRKTPSRYMQGPQPGISDQYFDLPGVPWNLYFTKEGGAIHGSYWHDHFGTQWSHGCVNLPPDKARALYMWADLGTAVTVRD